MKSQAIFQWVDPLLSSWFNECWNEIKQLLPAARMVQPSLISQELRTNLYGVYPSEMPLSRTQDHLHTSYPHHPGLGGLAQGSKFLIQESDLPDFRRSAIDHNDVYRLGVFGMVSKSFLAPGIWA